MPDTPPVSGPGALSRRTDLAPGQPIRVPTGLPYGSGKQLEQAQATIGLPGPGAEAQAPGVSSPPPVAEPALPSLGGPQAPPPDLIAALSHMTERPGESITTPPGGAGFGQPSDTVRDLLTQLSQSPIAGDEIRYLVSTLDAGRR